MADETKKSTDASAEAVRSDNGAVQPDKNSNKHKKASRLAVAAALGVAGGRLAAESVVIWNALFRRENIDGNIFAKIYHVLVGSVKKKNTLIAAGIGATLFGIIGWVRGDRIEHPFNLIKEPFRSLKLIFGKAPQDNQSDSPSHSSSPVPSVSDTKALGNNTSSDWQIKTASRAKQDVGIT